MCSDICVCNRLWFLQELISDYKRVFFHMFKFYKKYWIVFAIFIPTACMFGLQIGGVSSFLKNFTGWHGYFSGAWWYIRVYIVLVLAFPVVNLLLKNWCKPELNKIKMLFC